MRDFTLFPINLRKYRKHLGISQCRLSELSGVHANTIANVEWARTTPNLYSALKLADALKVTIDYLTEGEIEL